MFLVAYDVLKVFTYHWAAVFKHQSSILGDNLLRATQAEYIWACDAVVEIPSDIAASVNQGVNHNVNLMHIHSSIVYISYTCGSSCDEE